MKIKNNLFTALIAIISIWTGCKKDTSPVPNPPPIQNEEEVITTLTLMFDDTSAANADKVATFRDPDGDGGAGPDIFDTIRLEQNKSYLVSIIILNETASPVDTISNEVFEEANDHHFFFHHTGAAITTTYLDLDTNVPPLPIGLNTRWQSGTASTGTSQVILKHQPGAKNGTETPGETDIDVTFQTIIQ